MVGESAETILELYLKVFFIKDILKDVFWGSIEF